MSTSSAPNTLFSVAAFLGFVVVCIPLPWHLHAWNTGTCLYILWVALGCLNQFVNSVVWRESVRDLAPVWCDISGRIIIGVAVGVPAAVLCIIRRLYMVSKISVVQKSKAEKRREVFVDLAIGLGIPIVQMAVQIVVEGHRYDVLQGVGCMPSTYNVTLAYPLVYAWPLVLGVITICYAIPCILAFAKRQTEFALLLASGSSLSSNRYLRLLLLVGVQTAITIPLAIYVIVINTTFNEVNPWISWEETHFDYWIIERVPEVRWRSNGVVEFGVETTRWMNVIFAVLFFGFFGTGMEAVRCYREGWGWVRRCLGGGRGTRKAPSSAAVLPVYAQEQERKERKVKRPSIDTFASSIVSEEASTENEKEDPKTTTATTTATSTAPTSTTGTTAITRARSTSLAPTLPGTPLLPSFAPPDEDCVPVSSPSAHFAPQTPQTRVAVTSSTSSTFPHSEATCWSRASASLSQTDIFISGGSPRETSDHDYAVESGGVDQLRGMGTPAFPRSPTVGDGLSVWLARGGTVKTVQTVATVKTVVTEKAATAEKTMEVVKGSEGRQLKMKRPPPLVGLAHGLPYQGQGQTQTFARPRPIQDVSSFLDLSSPLSVKEFR